MNNTAIGAELLERREILERRIRAIRSDLGRGLDDDSVERAVEVENDEVLAGLEHDACVELRAISAALARMEKGNFGVCGLCGTPISEARLNAVPHTPYCVECAHAIAKD